MNIRHLPLLGSLFLSGLLTLGACGSSSSSGTGGTPGSLGGTTGTLGGASGATGGTTGAGGHVSSGGGNPGTGTGGMGGATACPQTAVPSCLQPLLGCVPSGTCVEQSTGSIAAGMFTNNRCYSNGVKEAGVDTYDATTQMSSITITVSKGGTVCWSETASGTGTTTDPVITIKNGAGSAVATLTKTADGTGTMVTCTGGTAVVLPDGCDFSGVMDMTTGDCTTGTCP